MPDEKRFKIANWFMIISIIGLLIIFKIHNTNLAKENEIDNFSKTYYTSATDYEYNYEEDDLRLMDFEERIDSYFTNLSVTHPNLLRIKSVVFRGNITYDITYEGLENIFYNYPAKFKYIKELYGDIYRAIRYELYDLNLYNEYKVRILAEDPLNTELVYFIIEDGVVDDNIVNYEENNTFIFSEYQ